LKPDQNLKAALRQAECGLALAEHRGERGVPVQFLGIGRQGAFRVLQGLQHCALEVGVGGRGGGLGLPSEHIEGDHDQMGAEHELSQPQGRVGGHDRPRRSIAT
jgi:hypothetical protein